MKLAEIQFKDEKAMFEAFNANNDTGFSTEDLVKIVKAHNASEWTAPMSAEEAIASFGKNVS